MKNEQRKKSPSEIALLGDFFLSYFVYYQQLRGLKRFPLKLTCQSMLLDTLKTIIFIEKHSKRKLVLMAAQPSTKLC